MGKLKRTTYSPHAEGGRCLFLESSPTPGVLELESDRLRGDSRVEEHCHTGHSKKKKEHKKDKERFNTESSCFVESTGHYRIPSSFTNLPRNPLHRTEPTQIR
jgi:hypothetical protein